MSSLDAAARVGDGALGVFGAVGAVITVSNLQRRRMPGTTLVVLACSVYLWVICTVGPASWRPPLAANAFTQMLAVAFETHAYWVHRPNRPVTRALLFLLPPVFGAFDAWVLVAWESVLVHLVVAALLVGDLLRRVTIRVYQIYAHAWHWLVALSLFAAAQFVRIALPHDWLVRLVLTLAFVASAGVPRATTLFEEATYTAMFSGEIAADDDDSGAVSSSAFPCQREPVPDIHTRQLYDIRVRVHDLATTLADDPHQRHPRGADGESLPIRSFVPWTNHVMFVPMRQLRLWNTALTPCECLLFLQHARRNEAYTGLQEALQALSVAATRQDTDRARSAVRGALAELTSTQVQILRASVGNHTDMTFAASWLTSHTSVGQLLWWCRAQLEYLWHAGYQTGATETQLLTCLCSVLKFTVLHGCTASNAYLTRAVATCKDVLDAHAGSRNGCAFLDGGAVVASTHTLTEAVQQAVQDLTSKHSSSADRYGAFLHLVERVTASDRLGLHRALAMRYPVSGATLAWIPLHRFNQVTIELQSRGGVRLELLERQLRLNLIALFAIGAATGVAQQTQLHVVPLAVASFQRECMEQSLVARVADDLALAFRTDIDPCAAMVGAIQRQLPTASAQLTQLLRDAWLRCEKGTFELADMLRTDPRVETMEEHAKAVAAHSHVSPIGSHAAQLLAHVLWQETGRSVLDTMAEADVGVLLVEQKIGLA